MTGGDLRRPANDEAAVRRRQPVPLLEDPEQQCSHEDEASQHADGDGQRHAHLLLIIVVIFVFEVVDDVDIIRRRGAVRALPVPVVSVLPGLGVVGVVAGRHRTSRAGPDDPPAEAFAGAAADIDVGVAKHVGHDVTNDADRLPVPRRAKSNPARWP